MDLGEPELDHLRRLVQSCEARGSSASAAFFADKLLSFAAGAAVDVEQVVRVLARTGQTRRAAHILRQHMPREPSLQWRVLLATCLSQAEKWEEALGVVGGSDDDVAMRMIGEAQKEVLGHNQEELKTDAAFCLQRGKLYEAMGSLDSAVVWYKEALERDARCFEAFDRLVQHRMLRRDEEQELLGGLRFPPNMAWMQALYAALLQQYDQSSENSPEALSTMDRFGLGDNLDVLAAKARYFYNRNMFDEAREICVEVIERDPFNEMVLPVYVCTLVELKDKSTLFYFAHRLVELEPNKAIVWFAVGSYYFLINRFDIARRYFTKATTIDSHFLAAWMAFGHTYSAQEESDQALTAYRTADRLFKGSHLPKVCLGSEYLRVNNLKAAATFLTQAQMACSTDPLVYNEIGCVHYRKGDYQEAVDYFSRALELAAEDAIHAWDATITNLGHAYRKLGYESGAYSILSLIGTQSPGSSNYAQAKSCYDRSLSISPKNASAHTALGFTHHLMGELDAAVECYHKSLGINPSDTFTSDVLSRALLELFGKSTLM